MVSILLVGVLAVFIIAMIALSGTVSVATGAPTFGMIALGASLAFGVALWLLS